MNKRNRLATKEDGKFYHEGHEEHEVKKFKIFTSEPFVAFVFFVVRSKFLQGYNEQTSV